MIFKAESAVKSLFIYVGALFGYLVIGLLFPWLWYQGTRLKRDVLRLPTPIDSPFGSSAGNDRALNLLGLGESPMAGVGIPKHSLTLTGLTAHKLNRLLGCQVNWKVLAKNGLTLKQLNNLIIEQSSVKADVVLISIGGNDVFKLTPPWLWESYLVKCVKLLLCSGKKPLILFSPVPPVGRFPAIPNPLRFVFGYWEILLQISLTNVINKLDDAHLLNDRFPDGKEYYLEDGIHPSPLAYGPWSEKLAIKTVELMDLN